MVRAGGEEVAGEVNSRIRSEIWWAAEAFRSKDSHTLGGSNQQLGLVMGDGPLVTGGAFVLFPGLQYQMYAEGRGRAGAGAGDRAGAGPGAGQGQKTTKMTTPLVERFLLGVRERKSRGKWKSPEQREKEADWPRPGLGKQG